jgi:hypothetical protein
VVDDDEALSPSPPGVGLYHAFAKAAWSQLTDTGWFDSDSSDNSDNSLVEQQRGAPAKGMPAGSLVQMTVRGQRSSCTNSPVAYARYALLETLVPRDTDGDDGDTSTTTTTHVQGIQVLNFVIIPALDSTLPVWGADFVALPGGKHLLLLDAQPMVGAACEAHTAFSGWYEEFDIGGAADENNDNTTTHAPKAWPWAGDLPPAVTPYVSPKALWTRLAVNKDDDDATTKNPTDQIQHDLLPAMEAHLNIYLQLLADAHAKETPVGDNDPTSALPAYLDYRRANDPARPMLQSLYGKEWTEEILNTVLFPELFGDDDKA